MRQFDLTYSTQGGRLTFKALNENGERALWEVISLMQESDTLESVLLTLKRKGFTVRKAR
jgi:hypothetical protein